MRPSLIAVVLSASPPRALALQLSRASLLRRAAVAAATAPLAIPSVSFGADDDADLYDSSWEDELPGWKMGEAPTRRKRVDGEPVVRGRVARDAAAAYASVTAVRDALKPLDKLVARGDFAKASAALSAAPFDGVEGALGELVQCDALSPEQKKRISTIKTYGVGADVLIMLGGVAEALRAGNGGGARDYIVKARAALDEVAALAESASRGV